jgi:hypothetical protein
MSLVGAERAAAFTQRKNSRTIPDAVITDMSSLILSSLVLSSLILSSLVLSSLM